MLLYIYAGYPGLESKNTAGGYLSPSVGNHHILPYHQNHHNLHNMPLEDMDSDTDDDESSQHLNDYDDSDDYDQEDGEDDDNQSIINTFGSSTNFPSIYCTYLTVMYFEIKSLQIF